MVYIFALIGLAFAIMYSMAFWYKQQHKDEPLQWGISWSYKYADELGIDPKEGLITSLDELPVNRVRLMSYWDIHEPERDQYDWALLDEQMNIAEARGVDVALAIGLRQPRWPECHWAQWAKDLSYEERNLELNQFMGEVLQRYDSRDVVVEYQLENEYLLELFGDCPDHERERLVDEYNYVKARTNKTVIVSRSNNAVPSWPVNEPRTERTAMSIYKKNYDGYITNNYFEYPFTSWYYGFMAAGTELTTGVGTFIHELQAEPYGPVATVDLSIEEQDKSMNAERLEKRFKFAHNTGMRTIDIWGAEWYYWRKTQFNDNSLWATVQQELPKYN